MEFIVYCFLLLLITISGNNGENITENSSFVKLSETTDTFCDINENCTYNRVCTDNWCRCKPNHRWNRLTQECESFDCVTHESECERFDPNRVCRHDNPVYSLLGGKCECMSGYYEDKRSLKCRKFCSRNSDCDFSLSTGLSNRNNHMVCIDFLCQCRPNYRWNITTMKCESFNCTRDSECWTNADENRECNSGVCECNFQEDMDSTKCYLSLYSLFRPKNYRTRKERLLLCTIFIIPSVLSYCLFSYLKKRRLNKKLNKTITAIDKQQTNINYIYLTKNVNKI